MFEYLFGFALLIVIYAHSLLIRTIQVDKIYPECFRKCKYGACDYYKEFYDPVSHKTKDPFSREIGKNEAFHFVSVEIDNYNFPFNISLQGVTPEHSGPAPFTEYVKNAKFKSSSATDTDWIAKNINTPKIKYPDAGISTIHKKDLLENLQPLV